MKEYYVSDGCVWFLVGVTYISVEIPIYQQLVKALQKGPISAIAVGPKGETLVLRADRKAALYVPVQARMERDENLEELLLQVVEEMPPLWGVRLMGVTVRKVNGNIEVLTPAGWEKR